MYYQLFLQSPKGYNTSILLFEQYTTTSASTIFSQALKFSDDIKCSKSIASEEEHI